MGGEGISLSYMPKLMFHVQQKNDWQSGFYRTLEFRGGFGLLETTTQWETSQLI